MEDAAAHLTVALAMASTAVEFHELTRRHPECLSDDFRLDLLTRIESLRAHPEQHQAVALLERLLTLLDDCRAWGVTETLATEFENNPAAALPTELAQRLASLQDSLPADVDTVAWEEFLARPDVARCPPEVRNGLRNAMGVQHLARYRASRDPRALDVAIRVYQEVVRDEAVMSVGRNRVGHLSNLAAAYLDRFLLVGDQDDLEIAIDRFSEALGRTPHGASARVDMAVTAAGALKERYRLTHDRQDLVIGIGLCVEAVSLPPLRDDLLLGLYHLLESARLFDMDAGRRPTNIDPLLDRVDFYLGYTPYPNERLAQLYLQLGNELLAWYRSTTEPAIFDLASRCYDGAVAHCQTGSMLQLKALMYYGVAFHARHQAVGDPADLEAAIRHLELCRGQAPTGSELHLGTELNLAMCLCSRYEVTSDERDLSGAMEILDDVAGRTGSDWPQRPVLLMGLADGLYERYLRGGRADDIDQARAMLREALALTPPDAAERPLRLLSLGVICHTRFRNLGEIADMETAIDSLRSAAYALHERHPARVLALTNLTTALISRHRLFAPPGQISADLNEAVIAAETAAHSGAANPLRKFVLLTNLSLALDTRADAADAPSADYDRAVSADEDALAIADVLGNNWVAAAHHGLGTTLHHRFQAGGDPADIDRAIDEMRRALDVVAADSPRRSAWQRNLGLAFYDRYKLRAAPEDVTRGADALRSSCELGLPADPDAALEAAKIWGTWASQREAWPEAAEAFRHAVHAIGVLSRAQQARAHKELWLIRAQGVPARAGYAMAQAGDREAAVLAVETGRATLTAEHLNTGELELELLSAHRPDLVLRYREAAAASAATVDADSPNPTALHADAIACARKALDETIREIQQVEGFRHFRAETSVDDLAQHAPLLYLASADETGYALLVDRDGTLGFHRLPLLSARAVSSRLVAYFTAYFDRRQQPQAWLSELDDMTAWLWRAAIAPLLDDLGDHPVVIPSGHLATLPLHAAWTTSPAGARHYLIDDVRLTYAPNALALAASRRRLANWTARDVSGSALVVADPTEADRPLPNAAREANAVAASFGNALILSGAQATRARVLDELGRHDVLHFACHGRANLLNPLDSGLALAGGERLTLDDVLQRRLDVRLAVLSACETALPGARLPDEGIGLPAGLVQAGAIGVIGSLWSVPDMATAELMTRFYAAWRGDGMEPAEALRQAQRSVRDDPDHAWSHPHHWAAFGYHGA